jgi:hypothetical protein
MNRRRIDIQFAQAPSAYSHQERVIATWLAALLPGCRTLLVFLEPANT